jgi:DNA-binding transcriptional ArsR family regulator
VIVVPLVLVVMVLALLVVLVVVVGAELVTHDRGPFPSQRCRQARLPRCANLRICCDRSYDRCVPRPRSSSGRAAPEHADQLSESQVGAAVTAFALLSDPTRVRMLWALRDAQLDVASLAAVAGCRPTVASQHLSKLRFAGLVEGRRDGQRVVYRLRGGHVRSLLTEALFHADHQVSGAPVHD